VHVDSGQAVHIETLCIPHSYLPFDCVIYDPAAFRDLLQSRREPELRQNSER